MSLRTVNGIYATDIRRQNVPRLAVSLKTKSEKEANRRHAAVMVLYEVNTPETLALIEQLRAGLVSVERVTQMVEKREALIPARVVQKADGHQWGTVAENAAEYIKWMSEHPRREQSTTKNARVQLAPFLAFVYDGQTVGDMALTEVPGAAIIAYQQSLVTAGKGVNLITTRMTRVGSLWKFVQARESRLAREQKRAPHELYSPVDSDMLIRETTRRDRFLSEPELEALFLATPDRLLFLIGCGAMAGLRMDEALHLRPVLDVDVGLGTITVQSRDGWKPKTRRSRRTVPMTEPLHAIARNHLDRFASERFMFPSPDYTDRPSRPNNARVHMQNIVERAGMVYGIKTPEGVVFHTLRHTFASHLAMRGVDLYTIAQLLGDSLQTTEEVYAKLSPDFKRAAIAKLGAAFKLPIELTQTFTQEGENERL